MFCKILKLLLSWIVESLSNLVSSKIVDKYLIWLKILNVHVMSINELWYHAQHHQLINMRKTFCHWILCVCSRTCKSQHQISNSNCVEWKEKFCKTMSLYNHKNEIFLSTFHIEHTTSFLHCKTWCSQSLHTYWVFLDLQSCKSTKIFNFKDYVQCVLVIQVRWQFNQLSQTSMFCQDVKKVSTYLLWNQSSTRNWSNSRLKIMKSQLTKSF